MITKELVNLILKTNLEDIPDEIKLHGKRSVLNWLGVAIGAANHESVDIVLDTAKLMGRNEQATVLGRGVKTDLLYASLINGMSSHIFDYDDTHLDTIHHPSGPVAPVVFALGEKYKFSGHELLRAFILGCEAELRISNAVYPSHYQKGWHITSSTGVFGAAIAAGLLLELNEDQLVMALGIAGTQSLGLREMFGTMTKPLHPGKAAQVGLEAAFLAKRGFTSSKEVLEAKRGFSHVTSDDCDLSRITENWLTQWELGKNSFKPYACGIVLHPSIDICIALRKHVSDINEVDQIKLYVNQYVVELTGKPSPETGLEGKFSIFHTGAVSFIEGDASQEQYSDESVNDERVRTLRQKIQPIVVEEMQEHEAKGTLILKDGKEYDHFVDYATGSKENPMDDNMLQSKFRKVTSGILGQTQKDVLIDLIYNMDKLDNIDVLIKNTYV